MYRGVRADLYDAREYEARTTTPLKCSRDHAYRRATAFVLDELAQKSDSRVGGTKLSLVLGAMVAGVVFLKISAPSDPVESQLAVATLALAMGALAHTLCRQSIVAFASSQRAATIRCLHNSLRSGL